MLQNIIRICTSLVYTTLFFGSFANATLGGDVSTVKKSSANVQAKLSSAKAQPDAQLEAGLYTVHESDSDGTSVREYVSPQGKVFAVTWRGVHEPDLSALFGNYFTEFTRAQSLQKPTRASRAVVQTPRMTVQKSGHMRDIRGVASVAELVPAGVDIEALP